MNYKIQIKRVHKNAVIPSYQTPGSAGFDFHLVEDIIIAPRAIAKVPTGLVINVPDKHVLLIPSRSSSPLRKGVTVANAIGVVDSDYCGPNDEIFLLILNLTDEPVELEIGDRLAQGLIVPVLQAEIKEVEEMPGTDRGGHGSTGC